MSKKLQLALLALLGFSTACSTVKHSAVTEGEPQTPEQEQTAAPTIRVLYGVPVPPEVQEQREREKREKEAAEQQQAGQAAPAQSER